MSLRQLHAEVSVDDSDATIAWCQRYGLIAKEKNCKNCHQAMSMDKRSGKDGKTWQCQSNLPINVSVWQQLLNLFTFWSYEELTYKKARREFKMGTHAFADWKMILRDLCAEQDFMWWQKYKEDPFKKIISEIRAVYPQ